MKDFSIEQSGNELANSISEIAWKEGEKRFSSIDFVRDFVQGKQIRIIRSYDLYFTWSCCLCVQYIL